MTAHCSPGGDAPSLGDLDSASRIYWLGLGLGAQCLADLGCARRQTTKLPLFLAPFELLQVARASDLSSSGFEVRRKRAICRKRAISRRRFVACIEQE